MVSKVKIFTRFLTIIISLGLVTTLPSLTYAKWKLPENSGTKQLCSTLGGKEKHFHLDIDVYTFDGKKGEKVNITLNPDPSGSHQGEHATLILTSRFKPFFKIDRSSLPNKITTVLPATGEYFIYVVEQIQNKHNRSFKGGYCLALESNKGAWETFRAFQYHYSHGHKHLITWIPERVEETLGRGASKELKVAFISRTDLKKAYLWITPELKPFINVIPNYFDRIEAHTHYEVTLQINIPDNAKIGLYDGTIHLRVGHRTYPETLKVKLNILQAINKPPIAHAGPDQVIALPEGQTSIDVQLDGGGSYDPDGTITSYLWTGTPDPEDVVNPTVKLKQGIYEFALQVTDEKGASSSDQTRVTVLGPPLLMPLPEVMGDAAIKIKGISIPGAIINVVNKNTGESKEVTNEKGFFEIPFDLTTGSNEFEAVATYEGIQSAKAKLKTTYTSSRNLIIQSISPSSGAAGSIITITGSGFTPDPKIMGVQFIGPEIEGTGSRLESKGVVLEASEIHLKVIVPFIFYKEEQDLEVYVHDSQNMSDILAFHIIPTKDPSPELPGNEVSYHLNLIIEKLDKILTKIEQFAQPRMPSQQLGIVRENLHRMISAMVLLKNQLNAISSTDLKSNLDGIFSSDAILLVNGKLEEINELLSHSTEGESYCNLARVVRILREVTEPLRYLNTVLDSAKVLTYASLALSAAGCFSGFCSVCCLSIPTLCEILSVLNTIDNIVDAVLGIFNTVISFLEGVVPTEASNWKIVFEGPFRGIDPHILYTNTYNNLMVLADFVSKKISSLLPKLQNIRIDIPDPYGMFALIRAITGFDVESELEELIGNGIFSFVLELLPIDEVFRIVATDLPVKSTIRVLDNTANLSIFEGEDFNHSVVTHSNTGTALLEIQATCGPYHYPTPNDPPSFHIEVIDKPSVSSFQWTPDVYQFKDFPDTCYSPKDSCTGEEKYYCQGFDYQNLLNFLCQVKFDIHGNRYIDDPSLRNNETCINFLACWEDDWSKCEIPQFQGILDNLCNTIGIPEAFRNEYVSCGDLIKKYHESFDNKVDKCIDYGHWTIMGKGFGVPITAGCTKAIIHTCEYNNQILCSVSEYRSYLVRFCRNHPYNHICMEMHPETCYDPEHRIDMCVQDYGISYYQNALDSLCAIYGDECEMMIYKEVDICQEGGFYFKAFWNGEPMNVSSPSFNSFNIYSDPFTGFMKPGWLSVIMESVSGERRESERIFVPPSSNLDAEFTPINSSLFPGDILYLSGNYFSPYEKDHTLTFTKGFYNLQFEPAESKVESYHTSQDLLLFKIPEIFYSFEGTTFDLSVKVGEGLPCQSNNCDRKEVKILPHESAGKTGADDQDLMVFGGRYNYIRSAAIGDVNGDGINDLIIGVPEYRNFGYAIGAVFIIFGPLEGLKQSYGERLVDTINLSDLGSIANVIITGDVNDIDTLGGNSRRIGNSIAVGDINGDGIGDILIGTTDQDEFGEHKPNLVMNQVTNPRHISGKVYIFYGRREWKGFYNLSYTYNYSTDKIIMLYKNDDSEFGYQVKIGNVGKYKDFFTQKEYKDIIITAPVNSRDANTSSLSCVYVFSGLSGIQNPSESGYLIPRDLYLVSPYYTTICEIGWLEGREVYQYDIDFERKQSIQYKGSGLGNSIAVGDINGDGYDDIILGAPQYGYLHNLNPPDLTQGAVYVIYGHKWPDFGYDPYRVDAFRGGNQDVAILGPRVQGNDERTGFGSSVHVVDLNGDGKGEIIIGAPKAKLKLDIYYIYASDISGRPDVQKRFNIDQKDIGEIFIIDGDNPNLSGLVEAQSVADLIVKGSRPILKFGYSLSSGDINNDGFKDLLVGAPGTYMEGPGHVWVLYGNQTSLWRNTDGQDLILLETRRWYQGNNIDYNTQGNRGTPLPEGLDYLFIGPKSKPVDHPQFGTFVISGSLDPYAGDDVLIIDPIADSPNGEYSGVIYAFYQGTTLSPLTIHPETVDMYFCDSEQEFTVSGGLMPYQFRWESCYQTYIGQPPVQIPGPVVCGEDLSLPSNFNVTYGENSVLLRINGCIPNDLKGLSLKVTDSQFPNVSVTREINFLIPDISVSPRNINFGDVEVEWFVNVPITVTNTGNGALRINDISLTTGSSDIKIRNNCPQMLIPQDSCIIEAIFSPTSEGLATGIVSINSNDPDEGLIIINLSGNGTITLAPNIVIIGGNLLFWNVPLGTSSSQDIIIRNSGKADLYINNVYLSGASEFSIISNNCIGAPIPPANPPYPEGTCTIRIIFTPTKTDPVYGNIYIESNDPDTPTFIGTLSGNGVIPALYINPTEIDFSNSLTQGSFYITNSEWNCVDTLEWQIISNLPSSLSVSPMSGSIYSCGGTQTITVQVNREGLQVGEYSHIIGINSNSGSGTVLIKMSVAGFISVTPASLDFAEARKRLSLTIQNTSSDTALTWNIHPDLPPWLTASQMSAVIPAVGSTTVYLYANRSGLNQNQTYSHTLTITSNGGNITIPVSMSVPEPLATFAKYYGGEGGEYFSKIRPTSDGGFIAVGVTNSFGAGPLGVEDAWVVKLDSSGYVEWEKTFGGYWYPERAYDIRQTSDSGYIMVAGTSSFTSDHNYGLWILKLNSYGDIEWQKIYGGNIDDNWGEWGKEFSIQEIPDNGYIVAGHTYNNQDYRQDVWILKLDLSGNIQWQKTYGGLHDDYANAIQQTADGGYIVAGVTKSFTADNNPDMWVLKLDSYGNIQWQKRYGSTDWDFAYGIEQSLDGGYIIVGTTWSTTSAWVIKLDASGDIEWQKTYGRYDSKYYGSYGHSIKQTSDGGYILTGVLSSRISGDDIWIVKIDSSGEVIWQKTYRGNGIDVAYSIEEISDGGFVISGYTTSFRSTPGSRQYDAFVMKVDSIGNIGSSCDLTDLTNITYENTNFSSVDTSATVRDSNATPQDTNAIITDSSSISETVCSETLPQAGQRPLYKIDVSPREYDFGYVSIGDTASTIFTVENKGYNSLTITGISLSGSSDFTGSHTCPLTPELLGIAKRCGITVFFTPSIEGDQSANLYIESNDPLNQVVVIPIAGTGWEEEESPGGEEPPGGIIIIR